MDIVQAVYALRGEIGNVPKRDVVVRDWRHGMQPLGFLNGEVLLQRICAGG